VQGAERWKRRGEMEERNSLGREGRERGGGGEKEEERA